MSNWVSKSVQRIRKKIHDTRSFFRESIRYTLEELKTTDVRYLWLSSLLISLLGLAVPLLMLHVYDRIIPNQSTATLLWICLGTVLALCLECLLRYCREQISKRMAEEFESKLSCQAIEKVLDAPMAEISKVRRTVLLERFQSIELIKNTELTCRHQALMELPLSTLYLSIVTYLNWHIGVALISLYLSYLYLLKASAPVIDNARLIYDQSKVDKMSLTAETLNKIQHVKINALEISQLGRIDRVQQKVTSREFLFALKESIPNVLNSTLPQIVLFTILILAAPSVINQTITMGVIISCMIIGGRSSQGFVALGQYLLKRNELKNAQQKINKILDLPAESEFRTATSATAPDGVILSIDNLYSQSEKKETLIKGAYLNLKAGDIAVVTGSNREGIINFLNLMAGLDRPSHGRVVLHPCDGQTLYQHLVEGSICYIPAEPMVQSGTILENITRFDSDHINYAVQLSEALELDQDVALFPSGFDTVLTRETIQYMPRSTLQRIRIVQALVTKPTVILIDSIEDSLQQSQKKLLCKLLNRLRLKATVVMATEDRTLTNIANRRLTINLDRVEEIRGGVGSQVA